MQTKQHARKKPNTLTFKYKLDILWAMFVVEGVLAENVQILQFLLIKEV